MAEQEAFIKEQKRLEKKKQQQFEQEMLMAKQNALEEAERNRQRNEENKKKAAIAAANAASHIMDHSTQEDNDYQSSTRIKQQENIDDIQDHYTKMMKELENKQKERLNKNKAPKNINSMANQRATEDELDIPSFDEEDKTVMMTIPTKGGRSKKDKDAEKAKKKEEEQEKKEKEKQDKQKKAILAAAAAIVAEQKKHEDERERKRKEQQEKDTPKPVPVIIQNTSLNRSNRKPKKDEVDYNNENSMTKKDRLELSMKKKPQPEKRREKEAEILPRTRVSIPYSKDEFDQLEQDFTVLDETPDLNEIEEGHSSVSDVDSEDFRSMQPHQIKQQTSPHKTEETKESRHDSDDLNKSVSNDHQTYSSGEEDSEEEEEDSYESEVESSSEDDREERRKAQKHKKLKGMDPIYDSSGAESIKTKKQRSGLAQDHPTDQEFSEDDEEEKGVFGKIGAFLFFGCGGSKDKKKT